MEASGHWELRGTGSWGTWVAKVARLARVAKMTRMARVAKGLWESEGLGLA